LRFQLDQFLLDFGPRFSEWSRYAAVLVLDLKDVIIAGVVDDGANSPEWHFESGVFERGCECFAFDPPPIAALIARAVFGINLRHAIELGATG
jgi:hypothetical protein